MNMNAVTKATDSAVSLDRGTAPAEFQLTERFMQKKLPAFDGASPAEAADDGGCALVSLNYIMISEGFAPFSDDEVQSAYRAALQAQLGNGTAIDKYESVWTLKTVSKYIGNPDDGGAMSQQHVYQLFCQRFGRGNFTFKRCDKEILSAAPNTAGASKYYLVTGILERAPKTEKGGVPLLYGTKREQKDTHVQNLKFYHTICVVPGSYFICKNKRLLLDGKLSYTRLDIDFLKLKADGNSKRGGYMRHIYRAFEVVLFRPVVERPLKKARVES
jgi:hypothetical protein